jgi:G3E family GTPase
MRFRLDGVVTLVDAINGLGTLETQPEAVKQVAVAERIVLTKTDLAGTLEASASLRRLRGWLTHLAPAAEILIGTVESPTPADLFDIGLWNPATKSHDVRRWLAAEAHGGHHGHSHDHHHDHAHDHHDHGHGDGFGHDINRHGADIRAFSLVTDKPASAAAVEAFVDLLRSAHGPKLLRMKGVVCLTEAPDRPLVLHVVQHVLHPPITLERWPDADHRTRLVFITRGLDESFVRRLFDGFFDAIGVDTPDRAALMDNPLAIAGFSPGR